MKLKAIGEALLDMLYPRGLTCACCGREAIVDEDMLCEDCAGGTERFVSAPLIENVAGYTAGLNYNDVSGGMVKQLKYGGKTYLAPVLAGLVRVPKSWEIDAVTPVPLHPNRLRERGFNQSELIARELCKRYGFELAPHLLERTSDTASQAGLSGAARRRNLKGAFRASEECRGLTVLLVDDVRTTGSTLSACASALLGAGCKRVYAATVCYAPEHGRTDRV